MRSEDILRLVTELGTSDLARGRTLFHARVADSTGSGATAAERAFLRALAGVVRPPRQAYSHPASAAAGAVPKVRVADAEGNLSKLATQDHLTASDLAWLDRLPRDPAAVPWEDARRLAALAQAMRETQPPSASDRRLVEDIWAPVNRWHDRQAAQVELANARQDLPEVPSSALGALVDAIAAEVPELRDDEVVSRASAELSEALSARKSLRERQRERAEYAIAAIDADEAARNVTTRVMSA